jgi:hypothetical protein
MWKTINTEYKVALTPFTQSGTHDDNFYKYCGGKKDTYYSRMWLHIMPFLKDMIIADLLESCAVSSANINKSDSNSNYNNNNTNSNEKLKRKHANNLLIEALKGNNISNKYSDKLAQEKIVYMKGQSDPSIRELAMKERALLFKEWERIRTLIKKICCELKLFYTNNDI